MDKNKPQLDLTKLTPEQRAQLDAYNQSQEQLAAIKDIADMTQESINLLEKNDPNANLEKMGALLVDMRGALRDLNDKEAPEQPDNTQPVIDAISKLEKALTAAVSAQKAPVVNVPKADAPVVNVDAPDFSKVEKILKTDLPKAFEQAIQGIVIPEQDDTATNELLSSIYEQLASIDTAVRMQPQAPTTVAVTNPDGSLIGGSSSSGGNVLADYGIQAISEDATYKYFFFEDSSANWYVLRKHLTNATFSYAKGTGGYASVYVDATSGPSGSPTYGSKGTIF